MHHVPVAVLLLLCCHAAAPAQQLPEAAVGPDPQAETPPAQEPEPESEGEPAAAVIEADEAAQPSDAGIKARLDAIFENLPSLQRVTVRVSDGVIILGGTVADLDSSERAEQLAERVAGAVIVVNGITRDRSIRSRIAAATRSIQVGLKDLAGNSPLLVLALAVIVLAVLAARLAGRTTSLFRRLSQSLFIRDLLRQIVQLAIVLAGIVIALKLLDATALLGSVVGALGILGLALGFATRDTVENYIASILLSLRQPFEREDYIDVDGTEGKVLRLTSRATVLMNIDGNHVRIPNAKVYKATIVNYSRNPLRRIQFDVGVSTDLDISRTRVLAEKTLYALPGVLDSPPPACLVESLGDAKVVLRLHAWIDQRESDYLKVRSEAQRLVKEAFEQDGAEAAPPKIAQQQAETGTGPDRVIDKQIRAEKRDSNAEDLLDEAAPRE